MAGNGLVSGADPGFFLGGGALVSCSTSTPINHIVFFCRIPVVLENRRSSQKGGGGVRTTCTLPLDPPLGFVEKEVRLTDDNQMARATNNIEPANFLREAKKMRAP